MKQYKKEEQIPSASKTSTISSGPAALYGK